MDGLERDSPLFDQIVPVSVKLPGETKEIDLIIRILSGTRDPPAGQLRQSSKEKVLRLEITDERDPFFLYTLEVGEEDYHELKRDQRLLVDFSAFPRHLIEMLEICGSTPLSIIDPEGTVELDNTPVLNESKEQQIEELGSDMRPDMNASGQDSFATRAAQEGIGGGGGGGGRPAAGLGRVGPGGTRWSVRLELPGAGVVEGQGAAAGTAAGGAAVGAGGSGAQGLLSVVEAGAFRELVQLGLRVCAPAAAGLRGYLGARLGQMKRKGAALARRARDLEAALAEERAAAARAGREAADLRARRDADLAGERAAAALAAARAREEAAAALRAAAAGADARAREDRGRADAQHRALAEKLAAAEARAEALGAEARAERARADEEGRRRAELEEAVEGARRELASCRGDNARLEARRHELEKEVHGQQVAAAAAEQRLAAQADALERAEGLHRAARGEQQQIAESLALYKQNVENLQAKLGASVEEIKKGNQIITRIQGEYKTCKAKVKLKSDVIRQQEKVIEDQKNSFQEARARALDLGRELGAERERAGRLEKDLGDARAKLRESHAVIESNQQVINWLNKEINEAQLGGGLGVGGVGPPPPLFSSTGGRPAGAGVGLAAVPSPRLLDGISREEQGMFASPPAITAVGEGTSLHAAGGVVIDDGDSFLRQAMAKYGVRGSFKAPSLNS